MKYFLFLGYIFFTIPFSYSDESSSNSDVVMGMTVHGDVAAAVGLYLMPWKNEELSDVDRPPRLLDENIAVIDAEEFIHQAEWEQAKRDYQLWRLQRNNW
ncbi:Uncharacterised protein [Zhongshania aliphaticivorans]|uniref:Uncharacterized protein n=1 Tax=Zhongshania aliphaticivorans TaxID=1470434 RepID=A0A5S9NVV5_9GAMM|nr:hypothetical protein [Zhongshania aliphaticivorans]CAA0094794.1 Uncharacterised protein [Zhongshania aliphaticivorans]CAA0112693.1 Uncharacterised protein [Zhongshania aliphaticivorans]